MFSRYPIAGAPFSGESPGSLSITGSAEIALQVSGTLSGEIAMEGGAIIGVIASGALSVESMISGLAAVGITASGSLTTLNTLAGTSLISITATGSLKSDNQLSGVAQIGVTAGGTLSAATALSGAVGIGVTASGAMVAQVALSGSVGVSVSAGGTISVPVSISGSVGILLSASGTILAQQVIAAAAAGAVTAWVVNLATGGHSTYSNFVFNSFFRLGADYYGCSDAGFVKLSGSTDAGTSIPWATRTGITTFNDPRRKYVRNGRVTMRADGDVAIREIVDEELDISNALILEDCRTGIHARRVKLPRGAEGTAWQFEISGTSTVADIKSLEVESILSQRT